MKIWSSVVNEIFGFIGLTEGDAREGWFFHSRAQGRQIAELAREDVNQHLFLQDLEQYELPEESDVGSLKVEGRVVDTMTWLIGPLARVGHGEIMIFAEEEGDPFLFFLLTPGAEDREPNALIGFRDQECNHRTIIFYSRVQGRQVLAEYCDWLSPDILQSRLSCINKACLPEQTSQKMVSIGEPISAFLHQGYVLNRQGGGL